MKKYNISSRLTFSNSLITEEHLSDTFCNGLCELLSNSAGNIAKNETQKEDVLHNGVIIYSDLLLEYIKEKYPELYFVSSTTKVILEKELLIQELNCDSFRYVVPDFRFNKCDFIFNNLSEEQKDKIELLCNECCDFGCKVRKECYEFVSHRIIGDDVSEHVCSSEYAKDGYIFSKAMENPGFISLDDIINIYLPKGITNFKIEGRSIGSALILEFLLYYMTRPECQLMVREALYLDHSLDLM